MRILDRQRYWAFIKAYFICYFSLVGLYIVIDAFSNLDEFAKRADGAVEIFQVMFRYYAVHQSQMFDQLCGVIGMMAAIFTVTWMQRNNEQLAMLAAGISTHRAIRPVLVSSVIVAFLAVGNQELIMPRFAEELAKNHDDDGVRKVPVSSRYDSRSIMLFGREANRAKQTIMPFHATIPVNIFGSIRDIRGAQATYISPNDPTAPIKGGWLIRDARIKPPLEDSMLEASSQVLIRVDDQRGFPPPVRDDPKPEGVNVPAAQDQPEPSSVLSPRSEVVYMASLPPFPFCDFPSLLSSHLAADRKIDLGQGTYFLKSGLTFQAMTRKATWYQFAPTRDLIEGLTDPSTEGTERSDVLMFVHSRLIRPLLSINLLFMSLPLVLGGFGRNTFINLGLALGNCALFYGTTILCQYLGSFSIVSPPAAAWIPLLGFGTIASIRWGQIRT